MKSRTCAASARKSLGLSTLDDKTAPTVRRGPSAFGAQVYVQVYLLSDINITLRRSSGAFVFLGREAL